MEFINRNAAVSYAVEMAEAARDAREAVTYRVYYLSGRNIYQVSSLEKRNLPIICTIETDGKSVWSRHAPTI